MHLDRVIYEVAHALGIAAGVVGVEGGSTSLLSMALNRPEGFRSFVKQSKIFFGLMDDLIDEGGVQDLLPLECSLGTQPSPFLQALLDRVQQVAEKTQQDADSGHHHRYTERIDGLLSSILQSPFIEKEDVISFGNLLCQQVKEELLAIQRYQATGEQEHRQQASDLHMEISGLYTTFFAHIMSRGKASELGEITSPKDVKDKYPHAYAIGKTGQIVDEITDIISDARDELRTGTPSSNLLLTAMSEKGTLQGFLAWVETIGPEVHIHRHELPAAAQEEIDIACKRYQQEHTALAWVARSCLDNSLHYHLMGDFNRDAARQQSAEHHIIR